MMRELDLIHNWEYLIYRSLALAIFFKIVFEICTTIVTLSCETNCLLGSRLINIYPELSH